MRATFRLEDVPAIQATMSITMSLEEWGRLRKLLQDQPWPASRLSSAIVTLLMDAEKKFNAEEKEAL